MPALTDSNESCCWVGNATFCIHSVDIIMDSVSFFAVDIPRQDLCDLASTLMDLPRGTGM